MPHRPPRYFVVLVTAPDLKTARNLAQAALSKRLVACANIVSGVESHYWWEGKLESATEQLLHFKTTEPNIDALRSHIEQEHPYDIPEFVAIEISSGSQAYLNWIQEATISQGRSV